MNNKGENSMAGIGFFLGAFVLVIVGIALFQASAQNVGLASTTIDIENQSMNTAPADGVAQYFTNIKSISGVIVFNATNDETVPADNYTVETNVIDPTTGGLAISITPTVVSHDNADGIWTFDGSSAQPVDYITDSGARAVAGLIAIFFALAIGVVALIPALRSEVLSRMGK